MSQELADYIKQVRGKGFKDEEIKKILLESGWQEKEIGLFLVPDLKSSNRFLKPSSVLILTILIIAVGGYFVLAKTQGLWPFESLESENISSLSFPNEFSVGVHGFPVLTIEDGMGRRAGLNLEERFDEMEDSKIRCFVEFCDISINNIPNGVYILTLWGNRESSFMLNIDYLSKISITNNQYFGYFHGGQLSYQLIIDGGKTPAVVLKEKIKSVGGIGSVSAEVDGKLVTKISWDKMPEALSYNVYGKKDEPFFSFLKNTTSVEYIASHPWKSWGDDSKDDYSYGVTAVGPGGEESFFSFTQNFEIE